MIPAPTNDHCTCLEVFGEDPACVFHGTETPWGKEHSEPQCRWCNVGGLTLNHCGFCSPCFESWSADE